MMVKNTASGRSQENLQEQNPKQIKKILASVICCAYMLNQHLKISAKKIWIVCFYLVFGHAVGQYTVTLGATTHISLEIQHECGNNFSFESFNLTVVST